ncbi:hypothetical protein ACFYU5_04580 [Nocardia aobensis]|uniref:TPR repeat domain-containing protein n=1 Tax=Nocardia aobensis TaxID=257277 RepID=A0ABW6NZY8_9NOCA
MPTRPDVEKWNTGKLSEWAAQIDTAIGTYETQLGRMLTQFTGTNWVGGARDAAYDRFSEENTEGRKLSQEIRDATAALRGADGRLADERRILLGKVADAEADTESPLALIVNDRWAVQTKQAILSGSQIQDDLRKTKERIDHHQGLINTAYYSLAGAISEVATAITNAAEKIRGRGDLLGSGIDAPVTPADTAKLGRDDGKAVHDALRPDGTIDKAKLEEIAGHLPQGILTEQELRDLADGKEVATIPAETQQYYHEFFQGAGKDGLVALTDQLSADEKAGKPGATDKLNALGNAMFALSNEKVGTGRGPDGKLQNPGSYNQLPQDLRDLLDRRSQDLDPAKLARPGQQAKDFHQLMSISDLVSHASPGNQPGTTLGIELQRQGASMADYLDSNRRVHGDILQGEGWQPGDAHRIDDSARKFFTAGLTNHDSSSALITGKLPPDVPTPHGDDVRPHADYDRGKFANEVLHHDWGDKGKTAAKLFDWVANDTHETGADGRPTEHALKARETLANLPNFFAPPETHGPNGDQPALNRHGDLATLKDGTTIMEDNAKLFAKDPELSKSLASVMGSNIDSFGERFPATGVADDGQLRLSSTDADRLLFLASQSDQGRLTLEVSRQAYEQTFFDDAFAKNGPNAGSVISEQSKYFGGLDGRITSAAENAMTFQDQADVKKYNDHQMHIYNVKKEAAKIIADMATAPLKVGSDVPGANYANVVAKHLTDGVVNHEIDGFVPKPQELRQVYPDIKSINAAADLDEQRRMINAAIDSGQDVGILKDPTTHRAIDFNLPTQAQLDARQGFNKKYGLEGYLNEYSQHHSIETLQDTARTQADLKVILTGRDH